MERQDEKQYGPKGVLVMDECFASPVFLFATVFEIDLVKLHTANVLVIW